MRKRHIKPIRELFAHVSELVLNYVLTKDRNIFWQDARGSHESLESLDSASTRDLPFGAARLLELDPSALVDNARRGTACRRDSKSETIRRGL